MLEGVGLSIAMGNAPDDIKRICKAVTDDNNHDGVAKAIERYILSDN
jgi:hydroxymethylpyrimidine pyrophosphatase-like HAD family hydrolase